MHLSTRTPRNALLALLLPALSLTSIIPPRTPSLPETANSEPLINHLSPSIPAKPLPLLIWHGLGDRFDAEGLHSVGELAQQIHPGTYIHYVSAAAPGDDKQSGGADRTASFFGNVSVQIEEVCEDLKRDPRLWRRSNSQSNVDGEEKKHELRVDALGFSQGGQFLRGLLQRCEPLQIRSLVTFGSQHNGIARFQECGAWDFVCKGATALVQGNVWTDTVQGRVVPGQYFREVNESTGLGSEVYLEKSHFLADVNSEWRGENSSLSVRRDDEDDEEEMMRKKRRGESYKGKIAALEKFVMIVFENDTTVIPKESGWFADVNLTSGDVTPLRERRLYKEDWIGLKELDEKDGLVFKTHPGRHMALDEDVLIETFSAYFGPEFNEKVKLQGAGKLQGFALKRLSWWSRFWGNCWAWWVNGAMVAPPEFAVDVPFVPKEAL